jgi:anti-sigma-K factor RskA
MNHEIFDDLCAMHAFGALDGEDIRLFEDHVKAGCALCEEHLREYKETMQALPLSKAAPAPSSALRQRIQGIPQIRQFARFRMFMALAAAFLVIVCVAVVVRPVPVDVQLAGRDLNCSSCRMHLTWVPGTKEVVVQSEHVCHCPPGKTYQLWYIVDGKPRPAGVFNSEPDGRLLARADLAEVMSKVEGFAVSIEDGGRKETPGWVVMNSR